jgi:DNA topoisomerase-3
MITILAEKPDVGNKIAAALDKITLANGKDITFSALKSNEKAVKAQQAKDGFLRIHYAGEDCFVTWGFGHLGQLKDAADYNPDYKNWRKMPLPFLPNPYELRLRTDGSSFDARTKKQFELIKRMFLKSDYIINATDFDREGEVIFSYIYELTGSRAPVKRVCFASQTKEGILDAFSKLKTYEEVKNIETAGRMRGIADWVVGINLTVAMTLHQHAKGEVLSIGRVQTPTLKMLVDRELAIRNFKPEKYWTLEATFQTDKGETYTATHKGKRFNDKNAVADILKKINGKNGTVSEITEKKEEKHPPQLYSLSALQMDANAKFGMTLKQTLDAAQALYDAGLTTYPRTDSRYLTEDMVPTVNRVLDKLAENPDYTALIDGRKRSFTKWRYFDDKKVESHFAIIPTTSKPKGLTGYQAKVYDLIAKNVICMLYGDAVISRTNVTTTVEGEAFTSSGSTILEPGFMAVTGKDKENYLPMLTKGEAVSGTYEVKEKETEPPKRYTDKTMLAAMISAGKDLEDEELKKILADPSVAGIGTPATRDAIIETLLKRGYAERSKKTLSATDKGIGLIQGLTVESIKSPALTAKWEKRLHEIERGNEDAAKFQSDIEKTVTVWCKEIGVSPVAPTLQNTELNPPVPCPVCGRPMKKQSWGYGCSGYKDGCKFSVGTICKKILTEAQFRKLITERDTGLISGFRSKAGKSFRAHLILDEQNKVVFKFENPKGDTNQKEKPE